MVGVCVLGVLMLKLRISVGGVAVDRAEVEENAPARVVAVVLQNGVLRDRERADHAVAVAFFGDVRQPGVQPRGDRSRASPSAR